MARTLFVGDVHGCPEALERLLVRVQPTRVVLLGDLFTRGPDPAGVWKLIRRWNCEAVLGNHDQAVLERWKPGRQLPRKAFKWLRRRPHMLLDKRWIAVHAGIHPRGPEKTTPELAMHLRQWRGRPWYERYRGKRLVVHGHDARSGLNDRRPYTLGLDTGAVGRKRLTGYLLEKDRIVSVRSKGR